MLKSQAQLGLFVRQRGEFPVKQQLENLVLQLYRGGLKYSEAVAEFQKVFVLTVLRENKGNQVRAAQELGVHRNTLRRMTRAFGLDPRHVRAMRSRPPAKERNITPVRRSSIA